MLLLELTQASLYHGSPANLPKNVPLDARRVNQGQEYDIIDSLVDRFVPSNQPSRLQSWFLLSTPDPKAIQRAGGSRRFIYQVEPQTPVFPHHYEWFSDIGVFYRDLAKEQGVQVYDSLKAPNYTPPPEAMKMIKNYWNGVEHPDTDPYYQIEYTTRTIVVIDEV